MIIYNVRVFTEEEKFVPGAVLLRDDRIEQVFTGREIPKEILGAEEEQIDGQGCYCFPGMIDLHFHGCKGYDFCDGTREAVEEIARYEASIGVTAIAPATMTLPVEELVQILGNGAAFKKRKSREKRGGRGRRSGTSCPQEDRSGVSGRSAGGQHGRPVHQSGEKRRPGRAVYPGLRRGYLQKVPEGRQRSGEVHRSCSGGSIQRAGRAVYSGCQR